MPACSPYIVTPGGGLRRRHFIVSAIISALQEVISSIGDQEEALDQGATGPVLPDMLLSIFRSMATFGMCRAGNGTLGYGLLLVCVGLDMVPWAVGWWASFGMCRAGTGMCRAETGSMGLQEFHANRTLSAGSGSFQTFTEPSTTFDERSFAIK